MSDLIKKMSIQDTSTGTPDVRDIGADAPNIDVLKTSAGTIIDDPSTQTADSTKTENLGKVLKDMKSSIIPTNHADPTNMYGAASSSNYGHVKVNGNYFKFNASTGGLEVKNACDFGHMDNGNWSSANKSYDGSVARQISYEDVWAAPSDHAWSSGTGYGVATSSSFGHVKTSTGITNSSGVISVSYGNTAGTACQGNDSRLSNSRTPTAHATNSTTYGGGTGTNYGHVKLSDTYSSSVGAASASIAASQKAVYDAYTALKSDLNDKLDKTYVFGGRTYAETITENPSYRRTKINLPAQFSNKDVNNYFVSVVPEGDTLIVGTQSDRWFIDKSTGYFQVVQRNSQTVSGSAWFDYIVVINH